MVMMYMPIASLNVHHTSDSRLLETHAELSAAVRDSMCLQYDILAMAVFIS